MGALLEKMYRLQGDYVEKNSLRKNDLYLVRSKTFQVDIVHMATITVLYFSPKVLKICKLIHKNISSDKIQE